MPMYDVKVLVYFGPVSLESIFPEEDLIDAMLKKTSETKAISFDDAGYEDLDEVKLEGLVRIDGLFAKDTAELDRDIKKLFSGPRMPKVAQGGIEIVREYSEYE